MNSVADRRALLPCALLPCALRRALRACAALLLAVAAGCMERPTYAGGLELPEDGGGRTIAVTGEGRIVLPATRLVFDCLLTTDADTAAESWAAAVNRMGKLMEGLGAAGVPAAQMSPRGGVLSTRLKGWRVTQVLQVGLDDPTRMPALIEAAMGPGGANDVINVRSEHKNARGAEDRARERALVHARESAEMLAAQLSLRLGEVLKVEDLPVDDLEVQAVSDGADIRAARGVSDALETAARLRVTWRLED